MTTGPAIRTATVADAAEVARLSAQLGYPADAAVFESRLRFKEHVSRALDLVKALEHKARASTGASSPA